MADELKIPVDVIVSQMRAAVFAAHTQDDPIAFSAWKLRLIVEAWNKRSKDDNESWKLACEKACDEVKRLQHYGKQRDDLLAELQEDVRQRKEQFDSLLEAHTLLQKQNDALKNNCAAIFDDNHETRRKEMHLLREAVRLLDGITQGKAMLYEPAQTWLDRARALGVEVKS